MSTENVSTNASSEGDRPYDGTSESEELTLKWGTLKGWKLNKDGPAMAALRRYAESGNVSYGATQQRDNDEQKQCICEMIDALNADRVYLDWDGKYVSKDEAKQYVIGYGR